MDSSAERVSPLGLGGLVGALVERVRFSHRRDAVVARYDGLLRTRHATLMTLERETTRGPRTTRSDIDGVNFMRQD